MRRKGANPQGELNGLLDSGSHMQGELHFEEMFRIDGKLTGKIVSEGDLIVGESGEVDGEIQVRRIFISGTARGTLRASSRVEVTRTGKVLADIHTTTLSIEEGAFFEGRCSMGSSSVEVAPRPKIAQMPIKERA